MDTYVEQIVAIRKSPMERLLQIGIIVLGVILILTCGMLYVAGALGMFSLLFVVLAVAVGYGIYYFASQLNLEYEYIFTNGDFDVDKIISKRSRKRVLSGQRRFSSGIMTPISLPPAGSTAGLWLAQWMRRPATPFSAWTRGRRRC